MNDIETFRPYFFIVLFIFFSVLEIVLPKRSRKLSKRNIVNIILFISGIIILRLVFPLGLAKVADHIGNNNLGLIKLNTLGFGLQMFATLFIFDFFIYWQHRFSHSIPLFWRFHHIHHSDREMDMTTGIRFHPGEIFFSGLYKIALLFIFSPGVIAYLIYETCLSAFALFNHSNIKMPKSIEKYARLVLATPDFHSPHHSPIKKFTNSNYGNILSIWDYLFKTYTPIENSEYGLEDESKNNAKNFFHLLKRPFS